MQHETGHFRFCVWLAICHCSGFQDSFVYFDWTSLGWTCKYGANRLSSNTQSRILSCFYLAWQLFCTNCAPLFLVLVGMATHHPCMVKAIEMNGFHNSISAGKIGSFGFWPIIFWWLKIRCIPTDLILHILVGSFTSIHF